VGLVVFHPQRRVRQSALECVAIIGNRLGRTEQAIAVFRKFLVQEQEQHYSRSGSDSGAPKSTLASSQAVLGKGIFDVTALTAISTRLRRRKALPLPSSNGLIEYGVKIPTGEELINILNKMHEKEAEDFEFSTSSDESYHSDVPIDIGEEPESETESIRMSDLEKSAKEAAASGFKTKKPVESEEEDDGKPIKPDVAYILCGKGKVNNQEHVLVEENLKQVNDTLFAQSLKSFITEKKPRKKKRHRRSKKKDSVRDEDSFDENESEVYF
jgi:hypothetical protein